MTSNISRFLPTNTVLLAQRQFAELEELRALVPAMQDQLDAHEAQVASLTADLEQSENERAELAAAYRRAAEDRVLAMAARFDLLAVRFPTFILAALSGGFLCVFALRAWGW